MRSEVGPASLLLATSTLVCRRFPFGRSVPRTAAATDADHEGLDCVGERLALGRLAHAASQTPRMTSSASGGGFAFPSPRTTIAREAWGRTYESAIPMPRAYSRIESGR